MWLLAMLGTAPEVACAHASGREAAVCPSADTGIGFRVSRVLVLFISGFAIVCTVNLAMAFFLELFNANEATPFVRWVFRATDRIMQPFRRIFPAFEGESGSLLDAALLFAMFMYWLLALGMHALVGWIDRRIAAVRYQERWGTADGSMTAPATLPAAARPGDLGPTG
jgi:uncharacterized protein YggT (Ycf19 family)